MPTDINVKRERVMKRTLKFALLACMFLLVSAFMFTACYYSPGEAPKFHVKEVIPAVAPTCTEPGLTEGMRCSVCQDIIVAQEFIKPFGHTTVIDKAVDPTCTQTGLSEGEHCSVCGEVTKAQEILPAAHTTVVDEAIAPTCTATGLTEGKHCSVCNEVLIAQTIVGLLGHNYINNVCDHCGLTNPNYTNEYYVRCDKDGIPNGNGDYILFGEYPQTIKADYVTVFSNQDSRGYYLGSDGNYYAAVTATPTTSGYAFSNSATVVSGTVYYFKVEPIRWRILFTDGETAFILCDSIIANQRFDDNSNNYADSEIRQWLNETFYEIAFSKLQQEIILITTVDNSVYSTGYSSNPYACEDTEDKVFLLSYREVANSGYGFVSNTVRRMQTSDYSRATGVWMSTWSDYNGNGYWWLRSPNGSNDYEVWSVYSDGHVDYNYKVNFSGRGVVPALKIRLSDKRQTVSNFVVSDITFGSTLFITDRTDVTVTYSTDGEIYNNIVPVNAGNYFVKITLNDQDNYKFSDGSGVQILPLTIEKFEINSLELEVVYNATTSYSVDLSDTYADLGITVTVDDKNVGTKTVTAVELTGANKDNYSIEISAISFKINPATITVTWTIPEYLPYDNTEKTASAAIGGGVIEGDEVVLTYNLKSGDDNKSEGSTFSYIATLIGEDAGNYVMDVSGKTYTVGACGHKTNNGTVDAFDDYGFCTIYNCGAYAGVDVNVNEGIDLTVEPGTTVYCRVGPILEGPLDGVYYAYALYIVDRSDPFEFEVYEGTYTEASTQLDSEAFATDVIFPTPGTYIYFVITVPEGTTKVIFQIDAILV